MLFVKHKTDTRNTVYTHPNGIGGKRHQNVERSPQTNLEEGYKINKALNRSFYVITFNCNFHSSKGETPFERHYGRKPRTDIQIFLNRSPSKQYNVSAKPETLQVYLFTNRNGQNDQPGMKAPRKLKEDVSNKCSFLFIEKNKLGTNWRVCTKKNTNSDLRQETHKTSGHE